MPEVDFAARLWEDLQLRFRVRSQKQAKEGLLLRQGQYPTFRRYFCFYFFGSVPEFSPPKLEVWFLNFFSVWLSGCILDIMKMTDGLFYKVFEEVAQRYPDIQRDK